LKFEMLTAYIN